MARISYVKPEDIEDPDLREAMHQAMLRSTPRPEIQAVRAHQPDVMRAFIYSWNRLFIGYIAGGQRWISTLGIGHGEVLAETTVGLSPDAARKITERTDKAA